jgi:hypothetical protein
VLPTEQLNDPSATYDFLYLSFLECAVFAIEAFNGLVNQPDKRWAFLFDELEIAPKQIRQQLSLIHTKTGLGMVAINLDMNLFMVLVVVSDKDSLMLVPAHCL